MARAKSNTKANLEAILFEFIEPLVLLLKKGNYYYVASAMPAENGFVEKYLVVSVAPKILKTYLREECDLRFLFKYAPHRRFFIANANTGGEREYRLAPYEAKPKEEWIPDPQFFASSHTESYMQAGSQVMSTEVLQIDGNWELEDFGSLSRKLRDLYAFVESISKIEDDSTPTIILNKIQSAFTGKSFLGGYSYVNFFSELVTAQPHEERFDLSRIVYASPGEIELIGKSEIFSDVENKIYNFISKNSEIKGKYNNLHKYMSDSKLLDNQNPTIIIDSSMRERISEMTKALLEKMEIETFDSIHSLADNNEIKTAKISLAIYRRLNSTCKYFVQGRISYS